tara:strand:+ start:270 stop:1565 length:1296 start_codon:yes stop_codon:yes gene_type:complete
MVDNKSQLFNDFFRLLNKSKIPYAVSGRSKLYPQQINSDIDIIIPSDSFTDYWDFIKSLEKVNINLVQIISHEYHAHFCVVVSSNKIEHTKIMPDVCSDYFRGGKLFLKADFLLKSRIKNNKDFFVLNYDKEFIYYLLKKIDKGQLDFEQYSHLLNQWNLGPKECEYTLSEFFNNNSVNLITDIFEQNNIDLLLNNISILKNELHNNLNNNLKNNFHRLLNRIHRIYKPSGLVVAFLGPDGSGKTTIINGVKKNLEDQFHDTKQYHLFPKKSKNKPPTTNPHSSKPRTFLLSILKLFYFLVLYNSGYWFTIYIHKVRSRLVIFDRYYHDIIVDPIRYMNGAGVFWSKLLGVFIPKPDLWILLDASPEIIQKRKSEVPYSETKRQVNEYRNLFETLDNAYVIDANQSAKNVIYDTESVINNFMKGKTLKRLR